MTFTPDVLVAYHSQVMTDERLQLRASIDWRESAGVADSGPVISLAANQQERHAVADGRFALLGRFGQSRLDWSRVG